jgi:hypothetical protein
MMRALLVGLALLIGATPCRAQDPRLERLDAATRAAVANVVQMAAARSLPTEPLVLKALEGASKGATATRIVEAVRALAGRLDVARNALGTPRTEAELVAGASALYVGIEPAALARLRTARAGASLAMPLVALTFFVERGVDRELSVRWVEDLVRADVGHEELLRLQQSVDADIRGGAAVTPAGGARVQALLVRHGHRIR